MSSDFFSSLQSIQLLGERLAVVKGFVNHAQKSQRLAEIDQALNSPDVWNNHQKVQELSKEQSKLVSQVQKFNTLIATFEETKVLLELATESEDFDILKEVARTIETLEVTISDYEFHKLFTDPMDNRSAYLEIQAGSGGTEAQDWAEMLLRMYLRWGESHGYETEADITKGEVAGIKSASIHFQGDYAYGWLRTEAGVHRLVRLSPFDANQRRHTSFASVSVSPEVKDDIAIEIKKSDLKEDTFRASGAGGQHVQKTDSAIRITYTYLSTTLGPVKLVVQCQDDRSQHRNREKAMAQLRSKLYALKQQEKLMQQQARESEKKDITWGSQIRSYILDDSRVKDVRTGVEVRNTQSVLDGDIDIFLKAALSNQPVDLS